MKNATSELANVLVVITSVAILVAFFYYTIWPMIENNFASQTACEKAVCSTNDADGDGMVDCVFKGKTITCKYKG